MVCPHQIMPLFSSIRFNLLLLLYRLEFCRLLPICWLCECSQTFKTFSVRPLFSLVHPHANHSMEKGPGPRKTTVHPRWVLYSGPTPFCQWLSVCLDMSYSSYKQQFHLEKNDPCVCNSFLQRRLNLVLNTICESQWPDCATITHRLFGAGAGSKAYSSA